MENTGIYNSHGWQPRAFVGLQTTAWTWDLVTSYVETKFFNTWTSGQSVYRCVAAWKAEVEYLITNQQQLNLPTDTGLNISLESIKIAGCADLTTQYGGVNQ
jgi:hypothetical protein